MRAGSGATIEPAGGRLAGWLRAGFLPVRPRLAPVCARIDARERIASSNPRKASTPPHLAIPANARCLIAPQAPSYIPKLSLRASLAGSPTRSIAACVASMS